MKIGLYGGSFDPVHDAHVALARNALEVLALDELRWVPAAQAWQKSHAPATAGDRLRMLELATAGEPRFRVERIELDRGGPSYTIDTVRALQQREPGQEWWLLIGQDQHANLHTWRDWTDLAARVRLAVAVRPGAAQALHPEVARIPFDTLTMPPTDLSSESVRKRVARGESVGGMVPPAVASYIDSHGLYRTPRS